MKSFFTTFFLATMATTSFAHMEMSSPPPLRSKFNDKATNKDYSMTSPLSNSGSDFACKGFLSDLDTADGVSVADWPAGSAQKFTMAGSASHGGGSCQASLSMDKGKTFKVIHSYVGDCPLEPSYAFTVPGDTPTGPAVFAWTWFNKVGNREMYMNCASVTITAGSGAVKAAFSARPDMFVANAGNGCTTLESFDLEFPNPGPDVSNKSAGTKKPEGTCPGSTGSGGSDNGSGSGNGNTGAVSSVAPVSDVAPAAPTGVTASPVAPQAPTGFTTSIVPSSSNTGQQAGAAKPKTPSGPVTPTTNGECGGSQTCAGSGFGQCCSKYGYCGVTSEHCGEGCDPAFGTCGGNVANGTAAASGGAIMTSGAAKATGNSFLAVSNVAGTEAAGEKVTLTETKVVYSTVYVTDGATSTGEAKVNDVGGRSTFQTVTRAVAETQPRSGITIIPVVPR